jgi:WW domain
MCIDLFSCTELTYRCLLHALNGERVAHTRRAHVHRNLWRCVSSWAMMATSIASLPLIQVSAAVVHLCISAGLVPCRKPLLSPCQVSVQSLVRSNSFCMYLTMYAPHIPAEDQAAILMQAAWRRRLARRTARALVASVYSKVWDDVSGCYYYYNTVTGEAAWSKPALMGSEEVEQYQVRLYT